MTEVAKELTEVKKTLRSLVLSHPKGCVVSRLVSHFREMFGKEIPYRRFGFSDLNDFLRSIPDVIHMRPFQGSYILCSVADENTMHIQKMVAKQKPSTSGYANPYRDIRRTGGGGGGHRGYSNSNSYNSSNSNSYNSSNSNSYNSSRAKTQPAVTNYQHNHSNVNLLYVAPRFRLIPNIEKQRIKEIVNFYSDGLKLNNFDTAYLKKAGISFRPTYYGFPSLKEAMLSIPDIVKLIPDQDSFKICSAGDLRYSNTSTATDLGARSVSPEEGDSFQENVVGVDETLKSNLRRVLSLYPHGILLSLFCSEYERLVKNSLNYGNYGYDTFLDFVSDLSDVFHMHRPSRSEDFVLYNASRPPNLSVEHPKIETSAEVRSSVTNISHKNTSPSVNIKDNIEKVLLAYPHGVRIEEFAEIYKANCNENLPWKELGHPSLWHFFVSLDGPFELIPCKSGSTLIVHKSEVSAIKKSSIVREFISYKIPECPVEPVLPGTDYRYMQITSEMLSEKKYIEVYVAQVNNPGEIWLQLRGLETSVELEILMTELENIYNSEEGKNYVIPDKFLRLSLLCAVIYPEDNNWHRGKITCIVSPNVVEVFFVDYGSTCQVNKKYLRFLRKDLLYLQAQAIPARLSNMKPVNNYWTPMGRSKVLEMTTMRPLMAKITSTTYKNTVSVILFDTNDVADVIVNKVLIEVGLAVYSKDDESEHPSPTSYPLRLPNQSSQLSPLGLMDMAHLMQMQLLQQQLNYQHFLGIQTGMSSLQLHQTPEEMGLDPKVVDMMAAKLSSSGEKSSATSESASFGRLDGEVYESSPSDSPISITAQEEMGDGQKTPEVDLIRSLYEDDRPKQLQFSIVITLNDYDVHLINYKGRPYMTSGDISLIIWGFDVLKKLLNCRRMLDNSITVCKEDEEELFRDLNNNKVELPGEGRTVHLFPLECVGDIISAFHKNKGPVLSQLEKIQESFDPTDSHWTTEATGSSENDPKKLLQELDKKRIQLLMDMIQIRKGDPTCLVELKEIEDLITETKGKIVGEKSQNILQDVEPAKKTDDLPLEKTANPPNNANLGLITSTRQVQSVRPTINQQ